MTWKTGRRKLHLHEDLVDRKELARKRERNICSQAEGSAWVKAWRREREDGETSAGWRGQRGLSRGSEG